MNSDLATHSARIPIGPQSHKELGTASLSAHPAAEAAEFSQCFGHLDSNQLIWSERGLLPAGSLAIGDRVLDKNGRLQRVYSRLAEQKPVWELTTGSFRFPLKATEDHRCLVARRSEVDKKIPFISYREPAKPRGHYRGDMRRMKPCRRSHPNNPVVVSESRTDQIKYGDLFLFPVIPDSERIIKPLYAENVVREYDRGCPHDHRIYELPVNRAVAYAYGVYLAEGNGNERNVVFSFHAKEAKTLALRVSMILGTKLRLNSKIYVYDDRNGSKVICSKRDLESQLSFWFGDGCTNKRIPTETLYWPTDIQEALLLGYLHGDGHADRPSAVTVSEELAAGLYALAIQCRRPMTVSYKEGYTDKGGVHHRSSWRLYLCRESVNGFFEEIEGQRYFWTPVRDIVKSPEPKEVVHIGVENTNSFLTRHGAVRD